MFYFWATIWNAKVNNMSHIWKPILHLGQKKLRCDKKQMTSACPASKSCTELGPAQPQLVLNILFKIKISKNWKFMQKIVVSYFIIETKEKNQPVKFWSLLFLTSNKNAWVWYYLKLNEKHQNNRKHACIFGGYINKSQYVKC